MIHHEQTTEVPFAPSRTEQRAEVIALLVALEGPESGPQAQGRCLGSLPAHTRGPAMSGCRGSPTPPATRAMGMGLCMGSRFPGASGECSPALGRRLALFQRLWVTRDELQKQLWFLLSEQQG